MKSDKWPDDIEYSNTLIYQKRKQVCHVDLEKELDCLRRFLIFQIRYRYLRKRMFVEKVGVTESTGIKMIVGVVAKIRCNEALKLTLNCHLS